MPTEVNGITSITIEIKDIFIKDGVSMVNIYIFEEADPNNRDHRLLQVGDRIHVSKFFTTKGI